MDTYQQLQEAIAQTLQVPSERVTPMSKAGELAAWDSLGHVNLMISLEQTFGVRLELEDFERLSSVQAILSYLRDCGIG
jgi:acyl carrier protein